MALTIRVTVIAFLLLFNGVGRASVQNAIDQLINVTDVGLYESQSRTSVSFGTADVRFPRSQLNLISIAPPSFEAGCGGISAHFGGISFVNGDEIMELLENAAQNAEGYFFELAFRALCGDCMETLKSIIAKIQQATKFAKDSCAMGQMLAEGVWDTGKSLFQENCNNEGSEANVHSDNVEGNENTCSTSQGAKNALNDIAGENEAKQEEYAVLRNSTWEAFKRVGIVDTTDEDTLRRTVGFAQLLLSATGTMIEGQWQEASIRDHDLLLFFFMCGRNFGDVAVPAQIQGMCEQWIGDQQAGSELKLLTCGVPAGNPPAGMSQEAFKWNECNPLMQRDFTDPDWDPDNEYGQGFLLYVYDQLMQAKDHIVAGDDELSAAQKSLIGLAPFPLYKVINVAATYPSVATRMISNYSTSVALILASSYFDYVITEAAKSARMDENNNMSGTPIPKQIFETIHKVQELIDEKTQAAQQRVDYLLVAQQQMLSQVNMINKTVVESIFARGLLGNQIHTNDLMGP